MTPPATLEAVRDFWNRRPCNLRHGTAPVGTREYFDQVEARKYMVEPHIPAFSEFERWRGKRFLDTSGSLGSRPCLRRCSAPWSGPSAGTP